MFKKILPIIMLNFLINILLAQSPISDITVAQRTDGSKLVDITYTLDGDETSEYNIRLYLSVDGETFDRIFFCEGDINNGIKPGEAKQIIWDAGQEKPDSFSDQAQIRIVAVDGYIDNFNWIPIAAGSYTSGEGQVIKSVDYQYEVMKYEVTNEQYLHFLQEMNNQGLLQIVETSVYCDVTYIDYSNRLVIYELGDASEDYNVARINYDGSDFYISVPQNFTKGDFDDHPVSHVTIGGAMAFATYYSAYLPSAEEFEKAATGSENQLYGFGATYTRKNANFSDTPHPFQQGTTPVGFFDGTTHDGYVTEDGASPYGIYDLSGNVAEICISAAFGRSFRSELLPVTYGSTTMNMSNCFSYIGFRLVKRPN